MDLLSLIAPLFNNLCFIRNGLALAEGINTWIISAAFILTLLGLVIFLFLKIEKEKRKYNELEEKFMQRAVELEQKELQLSKINLQQSNILKELWEAKRRSEQMNEDKDKFFSIVSHDLKSPFNSLIGFSEMMLEDFDKLSREELQEYTGTIYRSVRNVYNLLENLLEWSRIQTGRMQYFPVKLEVYSLVEEVLGTLSGNAVKKNISLYNQVNRSYCAYADVNMIRSVMNNLIANAIKFTPASGEIHVLSAESEKHVEVAVSDNGTGMSREDMTKLFRIDTNFSKNGTNNEKGTGLGLILCRELVEKNGGRIFVDSQINKGSTFVITLPKYSEIQLEKPKEQEVKDRV